jgi:ubiquinone biosynthesis protein
VSWAGRRAAGLLDFGSVGRIDGSLRAALQRLLLAMDRGDPLGASDALLEVMLRPDEVDQERLERALGQFMARYLSAGASPGVRMFRDLFRIVTDYGLSVPPEVAATFRALAVLEGTLTLLRSGSIWSPRRVPSPAAKVPAGWWTRPSLRGWSPTS